MNPNNLEIQKTVDANRDLFEKVNKSYVDAKDIYQVQYIILDYVKIVETLSKYLDGYMSYAESKGNQYKEKLMSSTKNLYDNMFKSKVYKKVINLEEFKRDNYNFLVKSKDLRDRIISMSNMDKVTPEMNSIMRLTDNQYKKVMKVYHDDMKIYLWITSSGSTHFKYTIDDRLKSAFSNNNAPVMHKYKKTDWE